MKSIAQQRLYGCGIARTAFVSGRDYKSIVKEVDETQAQNKGFYCAELVQILNRLGFEYEWKFITNIQRWHRRGIDCLFKAFQYIS